MTTTQLHETRPQTRTPRPVPRPVPHRFPTPPTVTRFEWFPRFPLPVGGTTQHDPFPRPVPRTTHHTTTTHPEDHPMTTPQTTTKCGRCGGDLFAVWETDGRLVALCEEHATEIAARLDAQDAATRGARA